MVGLIGNQHAKYALVGAQDLGDDAPKPLYPPGGGGGTHKARVLMVAVMFLIAMSIVVSMNSGQQQELTNAKDVSPLPSLAKVNGSGDDDISTTIANEGNEEIPKLEESTQDAEELVPLVAGKAPIDAAALTEKTKKVFANLTETCPLWSESFAKRYETQCGYWLEQFDTWETSLSENSPREVAYICESPAKCHGWGDRVAGMMSAFLLALDLKRQFKMSHDYLRKLFNPCLLGKRKKPASWANTKWHPGLPSCELAGKETCVKWNNHCEATSLRNVNSDRLCYAREHCSNLLQRYDRKVTAANSIGCGLRAILELDSSFFTEKKFQFKIEGQRHAMTLKEIEEYMKKYYVISIQMRLGDKTAFLHQDKVEPAERQKLLRPFTCASTVESLLTGASRAPSGLSEYEQIGEKRTVHGKKVLWFVATDTLAYKQLVDASFGSKIISFDFKPEHIGLTGRGEEDMMKEIAEWYVLGLADRLIMNKNDGDKDYLKGRFSGYSKTAWIYHLKHMVYDAANCNYFSLPLDGTWGDVRSKGCFKSTILRSNTTFFPQKHLLPIWKANATFPNAFMVNGKLAHGVDTLIQDLKAQQEV